MKRFVLIALLLTAWVVPAAAHDVKTVTRDDLVQRDGLFYKKFSNTPFTGKITTGWHRAAYKNGRLQGLAESYDDNGQLRSTATFKDGLYHGKTVTYYSNGQRWEEIMYKSGLQDGRYTAWWPNEQLKRKGIYKADKREGRWEYRNEDGTPNIKRAGTYQMGVRIGP